ncbi:hypothetical protein K437DRAFT_269643 [Tilletiaria anomala UBC 951]|uniref:Nucleolar pre-ribosomal-associated protein 1 C-terminal domain-containing protein n=1 Tax=Tilletiaria anomala (strain ATCC 24038 / CBS 436.72 / UBC 951) TaxID=1037660 RepID=A0A066VJD5_TILAU|nr:uncharacterized protein K437DRAFT_269643 [Tilletiaria anomala UBC 951]KDN41611.1 hypothetical protein K437DRAFT_269643 [Tilletiaria anomala UBC 951]
MAVAGKRKRSEGSVPAQNSSSSSTTSKGKERALLSQDEDGGADAEHGQTCVRAPPLNAAALDTMLNTTSLDGLRSALSSLRSQTRLKSEEQPGGGGAIPSPSDPRIKLVTSYLERKGVDSIKQILKVWDLAIEKDVPSLVALPIFALSNILRLLSAHYPTHALGDAVITQLLPQSPTSEDKYKSSSSHLDQLISYLVDSRDAQRYHGQNHGGNSHRAKGNAAKNEMLTLAALTLLGSMADFSSGKYANAIFQAMPWGSKGLTRLSTARRRTNQKRALKHVKTDISGSKLAGSLAGYDERTITPSRPDIRSLYVLLLLSLLRASPSLRSSSSGNIVCKGNLLSLSPSPFSAIFRGLPQDPSWIVSQVLQCLHAHVLSDDKLPRKAKLSLMSNMSVLEPLLSMYARVGDKVDARTGLPLTHDHENEDEEDHDVGITVAQMVHHFLLAVCTHPGFGITFGDQGWYPRGGAAAANDRTGDTFSEGQQARNDEENTSAGVSKAKGLHNPILYSFLRSIPPTRTSLHSELVLRICQACPELIGAWLPNNSAPSNAINQADQKGASTSWLASSALVTRILSLPLPFGGEGRSGSASLAVKAVPPPLPSVLSNLLPSPPISRSIFMRALSSKDRLMQHAALLLLASALDRLRRFGAVCEAAFDEFEEAQAVAPRSLLLDSVEQEEHGGLAFQSIQGRWTAIWEATRAESVKLLPDPSALMAYLTQLTVTADAMTGNEADGDAPSISQGNTLLLEATLRCIWLHYEALHRSHPINSAAGGLESQNTMDVSKLLAFVTSRPDEGTSDAANVLQPVCQLHTLRSVTIVCKKDAAQRSSGSNFDIFSRGSGQHTSAEGGGAPRSNFERIVTLWFRTDDNNIRSACEELLDAAVARGPLFELKPDEWQFWLWALQPDNVRSSIDEPGLRAILAFIDECATRCGKLIHRYVEISRSLRLKEDINRDHDLPVSPLFVAVLEQFNIRMQKRLLSAEVLPQLAAYIERLVVALIGAMVDRDILLRISGQCADAAVKGEAEVGIYAASASELQAALQRGSRPLQAWQLEALARRAAALNTPYIAFELTPGQESPPQYFASLPSLALLHGYVPAGVEPPEYFALRRAIPSRQEMHLILAKESNAYLRFKACATLLPCADECQLVTVTELALANLKVIPTPGVLDELHDALSCIVSLSCPAACSKIVSNADLLLSIEPHKALPILANAARKPNVDFIHLPLPKASELGGIWKSDAGDALLSHIVSKDTASAIAINTAFANVKDHTVLQNYAETVHALVSRPGDLNLLEKIGRVCIKSVFVPRLWDTEHQKQILAERSLKIWLVKQAITPSELAAQITCQAPQNSRDVFKAGVIRMVLHLLVLSPETVAVTNLVTSVIDHSLLWLVRRFAEDASDSEATLSAIREFPALLRAASIAKLQVKPHLAEPVIEAGIRHRLSSTPQMDIVDLLCATSAIPGSTATRLATLLMSQKDFAAAARSHPAVSSVLCSLVSCGAAANGLAEHLFSIYDGTLSISDRLVFDALQTLANASGAEVWSEWTQGNAKVPLFVKLLSLDRTWMFSTCATFPRSRRFGSVSVGHAALDPIAAKSTYDPLMVLSLFSAVLCTRKLTGLDLLSLLRNNVLGVVICSLSSRSSHIRGFALTILGRTHAMLKTAAFSEQEEIVLVFDLLRDQLHYDPAAREAVPALPFSTTLFFAHAFRTIAAPANFAFPSIMRFFLQRPAYDTMDLPLLYNYLSSASDEHRQERVWILRFLCDILRSGGHVEWQLCRRRHVPELLMSMYPTLLGEAGSRHARELIEECMGIICSQSRPAQDMLRRHGMLTWIRLQQSAEERPRELWMHLAALLLRCDASHGQTFAAHAVALLQIFLDGFQRGGKVEQGQEFTCALVTLLRRLCKHDILGAALGVPASIVLDVLQALAKSKSMNRIVAADVLEATRLASTLWFQSRESFVQFGAKFAEVHAL